VHADTTVPAGPIDAHPRGAQPRLPMGDQDVAMNNLIVVGALAVAAATGAGVAEYGMNSDVAYADVVQVTPLVEPIEGPPNGLLVAGGGEQTRWYNVRYRIGEESGFVRMDHDPGARIAVRNGRMAVSAARTIDVSAR
jgi:uncharacterized protein YcfJ